MEEDTVGHEKSTLEILGRRRWVLAVIFAIGCSVIYFTYTFSIYNQSRKVLQEPAFFYSIVWQPRFDTSNANKLHTCRNSVQGRRFIADERGYVCKRAKVTAGGCCDTNVRSTRQFVCDTCQSNGCCSVYEYCVSCCLQPDKQSLLKKILRQASDSFQHLFSSVTDQFELCLAKCRTSSQSVQHENSYRDPVTKFCYGESPPNLHGENKLYST